MSNAISLKRFQVQTRQGTTWEHADTSDSLEVALKAFRGAKRCGYVARVIDTTNGNVVS